MCLTGWACLFNQQTGSLIRVGRTGTGKGKGTGTGTGRGASPGPQCHNGKANDRRKMTVAMLKNVATTTTPMPAYVCVCVRLAFLQLCQVPCQRAAKVFLLFKSCQFI